jgi:copper chaperone CopZ
MKKIFLSIVLIATVGLFTGYSQTNNEKAASSDKTEKLAMNHSFFGVRGNCGMCKKTIEKAAHSVEGVHEAIWDKGKKKIAVSFDASKTNEMEIQKAIAASGYDTEKVKGELSAYDKLPGCCQYDRDMEMNQTEGEKSEHKH